MKNGQNTDLNNQNLQFWGPLKSHKKGQELTFVFNGMEKQKVRKNSKITPKTKHSIKNQQILMNGQQKKKNEKPPFLGIFGQKGPFWTVFGQNGQNGENFQKSAWNIFLAPTSPN